MADVVWGVAEEEQEQGVIARLREMLERAEDERQLAAFEDDGGAVGEDDGAVWQGA